MNLHFLDKCGGKNVFIKLLNRKTVIYQLNVIKNSSPFVQGELSFYLDETLSKAHAGKLPFNKSRRGDRAGCGQNERKERCIHHANNLWSKPAVSEREADRRADGQRDRDWEDYTGTCWVFRLGWAQPSNPSGFPRSTQGFQFLWESSSTL